MIFLQPWIWFGLPLILVPIIIHLINRRRFRTQPWAAMRFLISATRSHFGHAKLRQWLILLFRVLSILMLLFFLGRPLTGGWLGFAFSGTPDMICILLDRSSSMETLIGTENQSRREKALEVFQQAAGSFAEKSHLALAESGFNQVQRLDSIRDLQDLPSTGPTDTAADIVGLLQATSRWLVDQKVGTAEIWLASDLQRSNWKPEDARWQHFVDQLKGLPQGIRFRLLDFSEPSDLNQTVTLEDVWRGTGADEDSLKLILGLNHFEFGATAPQVKLPLTLQIEEVPKQYELDWEGEFLRWRTTVPLGDRAEGGWGKISLPADANPRDNQAYFVFGKSAQAKALVVGPKSPASDALSWAAASWDGNTFQAAEQIPSTGLTDDLLKTGALSLILWHERFPSGGVLELLTQFSRAGGVVVFFPPAEESERQGTLFGISWGLLEAAPEGELFQVGDWQRDRGALAKTEEGFDLPVDEIEIRQRVQVLGDMIPEAWYEQGDSWLGRVREGEGEFWFCGTLPRREWSGLGEGPVLVPWLQRLLEQGGKQFQEARTLETGALPPNDAQRAWELVEGEAVPSGRPDPRLHAGVYRFQERWLAVNRPSAENDPERLSAEESMALFGDLSIRSWKQPGEGNTRLPSEIWRIFLLGMVLFLFLEGWLILPARDVEASTPLASGKTPK